MISSADSTVTTSYTYDANGNTLTISTPAYGDTEALTKAYSYNRFNQQISVLTNDIPTAQYTYNAQGVRTSKTVGTEQAGFLLDGGNVVAEQTGTETVSYLRGVNLISKTADTTEYYLFNAHGDVVNLTSTTGATTKTYDYDAFGNERDPDEADENPFRYCGEYWDTKTGTYYLRARYYDPAIGRFTQQDNVLYVYREQPNGASVIDPLSLNLYTYCANNPILFHDPSGNFWETVFDIISLGWSAWDMIQDPSWKNAGYLAWDIAALCVPFLPGSYIDDLSDGTRWLIKYSDDAQKAATKTAKVIKLVAKYDDSIDALEFAKSGNYLVGSYREMKKYTAGYKGVIQAHHLLEQRLCLALGLDINDMISVVLTKEQHQLFTNLWSDAIARGTNYTIYKNWDDLRDIAKEVYRDYPELFALLDQYMNSLK